MKSLAIVAAITVSIASAQAGSKASSRSSAFAPGTGSKSESSRVGGYTKKDGTHVDSYRRTTPDEKFGNNYSTKGNQNNYTGKPGTKVTPEKR